MLPFYSLQIVSIQLSQIDLKDSGHPVIKHLRVLLLKDQKLRRHSLARRCGHDDETDNELRPSRENGELDTSQVILEALTWEETRFL